MNPKDDTELLLARVEEMRDYQRKYFKYRMESYKKQAIEAEKKVDKLIDQLKARGYDVKRFKSNNQKPNELF